MTNHEERVEVIRTINGIRNGLIIVSGFWVSAVAIIIVGSIR